MILRSNEFDLCIKAPRQAILGILVIICALGFNRNLMAQSARPGVAPNGMPFGFGIDTSGTVGADLIANTPGSTPFNKASDWIRLASDTSHPYVTGGIGVLDPVSGAPI